jgi:hypothetical protein
MRYFDENVIIEMIDVMLPRFSDRDIVLTFIIDFHWVHYSEKEDGQKKFRKRILVAIHRPSNYTKVMIKELEERNLCYLNDQEIEFDLKSDHDSCWRSDGFSFFFDTWCKADKYFEQFNLNIRKPDEVSPHHGFDMFQGTPHFWKVEMPKYIDRESRKVKIKFLKEMKLSIIDK